MTLLFQKKKPENEVLNQSLSAYNQVFNPNQSQVNQAQQSLQSAMTKPKTNTSYPQPIGPKQTEISKIPTPTTQQTSALSGSMTNLFERQKQLAEQNKQDTQNYTNQLYGKTNEILKNQVPVLQGAYNNYEQSANQSINDQTTQANQAKQSAEENFGTAQKQGAMTRNESEGRLRAKFAGNNALSSYGAGSYTAASSQLEQDFNTFTQQNIQNKVSQIQNIDNELLKFVNQTKSSVNQAKLELEQNIANINAQVDLNDIEKEREIRKAEAEYQQVILGIESYINELQMEKQKLIDQSQFDYQIFQSLSPEFKASGQPKNESDYYWVQNNPDIYEQLFGTYKDRQSSKPNSEAMQAKGDTVNLIDSILSKDTNALTGVLRAGNFGLNQETNNVQAELQQLSSQLQLASSGQLKGQGSMSDAERKILADAVLALNASENGTYKVSDDFLRQQLMKAKEILQRNGAITTTQGNGQTMRVREIRSGQTGTIPANEFDPSLYERI